MQKHKSSADEKKLRRLLALVIFLGIAIIVAFGFVIYGVMLQFQELE